MNRVRHLATVALLTRNSVAVAVVVPPSEQANTIPHRSAKAGVLLGSTAHRSSVCRSSFVSAIFGGTEVGIASNVADLFL
jgi:hypothetical protein